MRFDVNDVWKIVGGKLVYLACPYSDPDPLVERYRFESATRAAANLARRGLYIFSPLTHSHPMAQMADLPRDWDYWKGYDELFLNACAGLIVLTLPGWAESKGVSDEREIMREQKKPIWHMEPGSPLDTPDECVEIIREPEKTGKAYLMGLASGMMYYSSDYGEAFFKSDTGIHWPDGAFWPWELMKATIAGYFFDDACDGNCGPWSPDAE